MKLVTSMQSCKSLIHFNSFVPGVHGNFRNNKFLPFFGISFKNNRCGKSSFVLVVHAYFKAHLFIYIETNIYIFDCIQCIGV